MKTSLENPCPGRDRLGAYLNQIRLSGGGIFSRLGRTYPFALYGSDLRFSTKGLKRGVESLAIGWSNEVIGVFARVAKNVCDLLHPAFFAAGTKSDIDAGEPEHHLLE